MNTTQNPPHRVARILNVSLLVVIGALIVALATMLIAATLFMLDTPAKAALMSKLEATGSLVPSTSVLTTAFLGGAVIAGAYLYVAFVVRKIVGTTLNGNPFVESNINRLRKTWIVIALVEIFRMFVVGFLPRAAEDNTALEGFSIETRISAWFLVFVIAAMAEVFRIGLELRRDQELTV